jgi:chromosome segregation ATPase
MSTRSGIHARADLAKSDVVTLMKKLAKTHHSAALAQLASRIAAVLRYGSASGEDPFAKVKGLIQDMIAKLETEAGAEATEKAYCDEQMADTEAKKSELDTDISKLTTKIDQDAARSAKLKDEVKELQAELAALAKQQAEMNTIRKEMHADYVQAKADLEQGLSGVRKALVTLRDYYAKSEEDAAFVQNSASFMQQPAMPEKHVQATGSGTSIIGILEVVESDFATNLAKEETAESTAQDEYDKLTQENKITKATKDQDVKYKTQEFTSLDKNIAELSSDRETASTELSAVLEYYSKLKERCIAKPETYESRKQRRESEIAGLKQALTILESETSFVQRAGKRRNMRGTLKA